LTINYGLRYDYSQIPQQKISNPDYPQTGRIPSYAGQIGPPFWLGLCDEQRPHGPPRRIWPLSFTAGAPASSTRCSSSNGVYQKSVSYTGANAADNLAGPVFPNRLAASDKAPAGTVNIAFAGQ
jgi:hypothetical protein